MTTLDFTPARVDLKLYSGDDITIRLFLSTDAPADGTFVGTWDATRAYVAGELVEHSSAFYTAVVGSTNVTPGTDPTKWKVLSPLDLTGYTAWEAQVRTTSPDTDFVAFAIDASLQASSIISLSMTGTAIRAREKKGSQRWDLQAADPSGKIRTFFNGNVTVSSDASR